MKEKSLLLNYVKKFEYKNNLQRRNSLLNILKSKDYRYKLEKYNILGNSGINVILEFGKGKKDILATAHYDAVWGSPGANDNASSIAVLLDVIKRLEKYKPKNRIKIIFFDGEEPGLAGLGRWGSKAYVRKHRIDNLIGVYNLELCGMGDAFGIWPVTLDVKNNFVLKNLRTTLNQLGYYFEEAGNLPMFWGDHDSFREKGFKEAFCISVAPFKDREAIRKFAETPNILNIAKFTLGIKSGIPLMFQRYHSSEDKSEYLDEDSLRLTSNLVYHSLVNLDQKIKLEKE